jgi:hypothetical protein
VGTAWKGNMREETGQVPLGTQGKPNAFETLVRNLTHGGAIVYIEIETREGRKMKQHGIRIETGRCSQASNTLANFGSGGSPIQLPQEKLVCSRIPFKNAVGIWIIRTDLDLPCTQAEKTRCRLAFFLAKIEPTATRKLCKMLPSLAHNWNAVPCGSKGVQERKDMTQGIVTQPMNPTSMNPSPEHCKNPIGLAGQEPVQHKRVGHSVRISVAQENGT